MAAAGSETVREHPVDVLERHRYHVDQRVGLTDQGVLEPVPDEPGCVPLDDDGRLAKSIHPVSERCQNGRLRMSRPHDLDELDELGRIEPVEAGEAAEVGERRRKLGERQRRRVGDDDRAWCGQGLGAAEQPPLRLDLLDDRLDYQFGTVQRLVESVVVVIAEIEAPAIAAACLRAVSSVVSRRAVSLTARPARANTAAMPAPIVPPRRR